MADATADYELGKRHLANIMGEDPDTFDQEDIDVRMVNCIHQIASGGCYGFTFVTSPPPQCVERFHRYHSNEKIL